MDSDGGDVVDHDGISFVIRLRGSFGALSSPKSAHVAVSAHSGPIPPQFVHAHFGSLEQSSRWSERFALERGGRSWWKRRHADKCLYSSDGDDDDNAGTQRHH